VSRSRTLFHKIWDAHVIVTRDDGTCLLWIDRHLVHEGSFHGFGMLNHAKRPVHRPDLTFALADHYVPSRPGTEDAEARGLITTLADNARRHGLALFGEGDSRQGIVHVAGPEQGLTLPGTTLVCGDSHTSTHGAFGSLAFGIGASEVAHVLATQTLWQRRPSTMRINVDGALHRHVGAKDLILAIIARIGAGGAVGHVVEYTGPAIRALSMEARMTLCNMSIEAGARAGMVAPDETTFAWLEGRRYAPAFAPAWRELATDQGAVFDREVTLDASEVPPTVTWGTSPQTAIPITGHVPGDAAAAAQRAYMGLEAGAPLAGTKVDRVFIGSCTNSRLPDLRAAAEMLRRRRAKVPGLVVAGSMATKAAAEAEGLDHVFIEAGMRWGAPGCSMCVGMNGDLVAPGERCASTSNRNFVGRQGPGARTHLMSPAMAAAAAIAGAIVDVRDLA